MSRYLRILGLFLLLQGAIFAALFALDSPHQSSYLAAAVDKAHLLATAPSPRVVLVGGSNLAFGIDSPQLAAGLGGRYTPVNLGLEAGLGLQFGLNQALRGVKRGDVVVLSPEYEALWWDILGPQTLLPMLAYWPGGTVDVPRAHWPSLLADAPDDGLALTAHNTAAILYGELRRRGSQPATPSVYTRSGFNRFGDETAAWNLPSRYRPGPAGPEALSFPSAGLRRSIAAIKEFMVACRAKGVQVVYDYPPIATSRYRVSRPEIERTARILESGLPVTFLNSPVGNVYPNGDFLDTPYHLRGPAVQERTEKLIRGLQQQIPVQL